MSDCRNVAHSGWRSPQDDCPQCQRAGSIMVIVSTPFRIDHRPLTDEEQEWLGINRIEPLEESLETPP